MSRYTSRDGLCSSADPQAVALWDAIGDRMASEQQTATERLRAMGVRAEHPDDGWVKRDRNCVHFAYARFNDGVQPGDLIALGNPSDGYRIVRCTGIKPWGVISNYLDHYFEDTGQRVPGTRNRPSPTTRKRWWQRVRYT